MGNRDKSRVGAAAAGGDHSLPPNVVTTGTPKTITLTRSVVWLKGQSHHIVIVCKIWHCLICHSVHNLLDAEKHIFQNHGKEFSAIQGASCFWCFFWF